MQRLGEAWPVEVLTQARSTSGSGVTLSAKCTCSKIWFSPLELNVLPRLGKVPVADIDQLDILNTLTPIWHSKASTAQKAMDRLRICLRHAAALGLDVDLQVTEKANALLGKSWHKPTHIPAMNWQDVPKFYASLNEGTVTQLALRLLILVGIRSHPLRFLRMDQIEGTVWTIPAEAVKGRRDDRLPCAVVTISPGHDCAGEAICARWLPVSKRSKGCD